MQKAHNLADTFFADVDARLARQFEEKLVPAVDEVFTGVIEKVNGIEGALDQSKKLKAESVAIGVCNFGDDGLGKKRKRQSAQAVSSCKAGY